MGQPIWLAQLYFRGNSMPTVSCGEVRLSVTCLFYNSETFSVFVLMNSTSPETGPVGSSGYRFRGKLALPPALCIETTAGVRGDMGGQHPHFLTSNFHVKLTN